MSAGLMQAFLGHNHRPDKIAERKEVLLFLKHALDALSERERHALVSAYGIGTEPISKKEAAEKMPGGECSAAAFIRYQKRAERAVLSHMRVAMKLGIPRDDLNAIFKASLADFRMAKGKTASDLKIEGALAVHGAAQKVRAAKKVLREAEEALEDAKAALRREKEKAERAQAHHTEVIAQAERRVADLARCAGLSFSSGLSKERQSILAEREWFARTNMSHASAHEISCAIHSGEGIDPFGPLEP